MGRCQMCGAELEDASQRFCGGDRCARIFMTVARGATVADASPVALLQSTIVA
jgi:hypothetical protein